MGLLQKDKSKKSLQKGGEEAENKLRIKISIKILNILEKCSEEERFRGEIKELNDKYHILRNTYLFLGISRIQNKCDILRDILLARRVPLKTINYSDRYPLFHCLSSDDKNIHMAEMAFCTDHKVLLKLKTGTTGDFYMNHWDKFITFLRKIIRDIEKEILVNDRKTNEFLERTRKEIENTKRERKKEMNKWLSQAKKDINQAGPANSNNKNIFNNYNQNQPIAMGGPPSYLVNSNNESTGLKKENARAGPASLMQTVGRRRQPTAKPKENNNNLSKRLQKLMNNNN